MDLSLLDTPEFDRALRASAERRAAVLEADAPSRKALMEPLMRAWEAGDAVSVAAYGWAFKDAFAGQWKLNLRVAKVLIDSGRSAEALALLRHPSFLLKGSADLWFNIGRALASLGRLMEAQAAATRALYLDSDFKSAGSLLRTIEQVISFQANPERLTSWGEVRPVVEASLELRMAKTALLLVLDKLASLKPEPGDADEFLSTIGMAIPLRSAGKISRLLGDVDLPEAFAERLHALRIAYGTLAGRADEFHIPPDEALDFGSADLGQAAAFAWEASGNFENAARVAAAYAGRSKHELAARGDLARDVGKEVIRHLAVSCCARESSRVINLIPFNDEIDLLRIRMAEMYDWVDEFIIVEAGQTFVGESKEFYFEKNKYLFNNFMDKIRHVKIDVFPKWLTSPWAREFFQRDSAILGVAGNLGANDRVLLTDADEIVREAAFRNAQSDISVLRMGTYKYFFNYRPESIRAQEGTTGALVRGAHLTRYGSSYLRFVLARRPGIETVAGGGWHFTSVNSPEGIIRKMQGYAHQEASKRLLRDRSFIDATLERIRSGAFDAGWEKCGLDLLPRYITDNQQLLQDLLL